MNILKIIELNKYIFKYYKYFKDENLTEDEYRRRRAHPNFRDLLAAEKSIVKFGKKSSFKTYIVVPGLIYHAGDSIFHYLFKV